MARRRIDEVDPNKMLLLTGLGLFAVVTPLIGGGLVPVPTARMTPSSARMLSIVEQFEWPTAKSNVLRPAHSRLVHRSLPKPAPPMFMVAPPEIQAQMPLIIIVPEPQLPAEGTASALSDAADDTEALVCRPPQQLPGSQFKGPRVCLSRQMWDEYKSKGLVLMPDGRTVVPSFDQTRRPIPIACTSMGFGASNAANRMTNCGL